jgi:hypothetical protein
MGEYLKLYDDDLANIISIAASLLMRQKHKYCRFNTYIAIEKAF